MLPFLIFCAIGFTVMLGQGMVTPILPLYGRCFGVSAAVVGLLITSFGLARLLTDLPAGYLSERYGAAKVFLVGPAVTAVASLMAGLASSFWLLVFWRFWQGVGSALFITAAMVCVAELSPPGSTARNMGLFQGFQLLGTSFGPTLGGLTAQYGGYRVPFFVFSGLAALGALAAYWSLRWARGSEPKGIKAEIALDAAGPEEEGCIAAWRAEANLGQPAKALPSPRKRAGYQADGPGITRKAAEFLTNRGFVLIALVNFTIFFARAGARQTIVPLLGASELGLQASEIGFALTVVALGNLATVYLAGWLGDRWGTKRVLVPSILLASFGFLLFATSADYSYYLLASVILGIGTGLGGPLPAAYAVETAGSMGHGLAMGALRFCGDLGFVLGPVALGLVADALGYRKALLANAALMAGLVMFFWLLAPSPVKSGVAQEGTDRARQ